MNAPLVIPRFIPVPNGKGCRDKQRASAAKFRAVLLDLIEVNGQIGAKRLAELSGATVPTTRDHLDHLMNNNLVKSEKILGRTEAGGGVVTAIYSLRGDDSSNELKQKTLKTYPANKVTDPYALPTGFFGPAKQQQGE